MRKLTIKRAKRFVACLGVIKIYIEDPTANELEISGVPCRKLGELKNGQEKSFEIGEEAAKLFAIADTLSKEYCNELYLLPEGQEDIYLSGKNELNPATGNAFRFDKNDGAEAVANRSRGKKKGNSVLVIAIVVGLIGGLMGGRLIGTALFALDRNEPKTFTVEQVNITLTKEFFKDPHEGYDMVYSTREVSVFFYDHSFSEVEWARDYSASAYAELLMEKVGLEASVHELNGVPYFERNTANADQSEEYYVVTFVYKTDQAFWLVEFATYADKAEKYEQQFKEWAGTIEIVK